MGTVRRLIVGLGLAGALLADVAIYPLKDVRAGQRGVGKTVFSGTRIEEFQVEILGVLENIGPRQSIILGKLSGGPLERTGVMQGMSGSPVYIDGKLVGAVALAFPFSKEPIAGIRPFEEMRRFSPTGTAANRSFGQGESRLEEIATPVSFSGFTETALEHFAPKLRALGLDPRQGVSSGGKPPDKLGDPKLVQPGSMISVQLLSGDMSVGGEGTVTHVDGNRIWAFGHRFLAAGTTEMPFARAEVLTLLPNLSASFKIASAREWMGSITEDRSAALAGIVGRRAMTVPFSISVNGTAYRMHMADDRILTPLLSQIAMYSAIDATERTLGGSTFMLRGEIAFQGAPPVRLSNIYAGDFAVALQVAAGVASPLAYAAGAGFPALRLKGISVAVETASRKKLWQIDQVLAPRQARPGEEIEIAVSLAGEGGAEVVRRTRYKVPVGAPAGPLHFTVADGMSTNATEFQQRLVTPAATAGEVVEFLNSLRPNTNAYVRVWRADPGYQARGEELGGLPPSMALIFSKQQPGSWRGSKVAEIAIPGVEGAISGSRTVQVEVKE